MAKSRTVPAKKGVVKSKNSKSGAKAQLRVGRNKVLINLPASATTQQRKEKLAASCAKYNDDVRARRELKKKSVQKSSD
mgnify:CR=1 FL=1